MFYVYNDRTARITDPYTIPGNIQEVPNKKSDPDAILIRTKEQMFSALRTPVHDVKSSHYYKEIGGVRTPKELYRALRQFGAKVTQGEATTLYKAYPDNFGGFDFRKFADRIVCSDLDRRKHKRLDRVLVADSRRTNVYGVRALPPPSAQTFAARNESDAAPLRRDALSRAVDVAHPMHPVGKKFLAAGELDSKMQFPHSLPLARLDTHEALQRFPRSGRSDHIVQTFDDPLGTSSRGLNLGGGPGFHVSTNSRSIRPKTSVFVSETDVALGRTQRGIRPVTAASQPFTNARAYSGRGLDSTGKDFHPAVSRGLWSHSPIPEIGDGRRIRKHHPSSHKIAQLHHNAYRPMIRAAPVSNM